MKRKGITRIGIFTLCIILSLVTIFTTACSRSGQQMTEKLFMGKTEITLLTGETYTIQTTENECVFESSEESVASVSSYGVVTALAVGRTNITVRKGEKSSVMLVIVEEKKITDFDIQNQEHVNWYGRTYMLEKEGETIVMFPQSYSGFEVSFCGTELSAVIYCYVDSVRRGQKTYFEINLDGKYRTIGVEDGTHELVLGENLKYGKHSVKVTKLTEGRESNAGLVRFMEAKSDDFYFVSPPEKPALKLEFYGDSITCGHGIKGTNATSAFETINEDPTLCYAGQATRNLGAQANFFSYSGISLAFEGVYYPPLVKDDYLLVCSKNCREQWDFTKYVADVIIINLGANDWTRISRDYPDSVNECLETFENEYRSFIRELRKKNETAMIVCIGMPYIYMAMAPKIKAAAEAEGAYYLPIYTNGLGSAAHPDAQAGELGGKQLSDFIAEKLLTEKPSE